LDQTTNEFTSWKVLQIDVPFFSAYQDYLDRDYDAILEVKTIH